MFKTGAALFFRLGEESNICCLLFAIYNILVYSNLLSKLNTIIIQYKMSRSLEQWSWSLVIYDTVDKGQLLWDIKRQHINFAKNTSELYK